MASSEGTEAADAKPATTAAPIAFANVSKRYAGRTQIAVEDLSFEVPSGEICVLIGPSGCGKTTALKMVNRLIPMSAGDITIHNSSFTTKPVKAGATVTVVNKDSIEHTVTSDDGTSFNNTASPDKTFTFTAPSKPGTYKFHCNIHSFMHGQLVVQ